MNFFGPQLAQINTDFIHHKKYPGPRKHMEFAQKIAKSGLGPARRESRFCLGKNCNFIHKFCLAKPQNNKETKFDYPQIVCVKHHRFSKPQKCLRHHGSTRKTQKKSVDNQSYKNSLSLFSSLPCFIPKVAGVGPGLPIKGILCTKAISTNLPKESAANARAQC